MADRLHHRQPNGATRGCRGGSRCGATFGQAAAGGVSACPVHGGAAITGRGRVCSDRTGPASCGRDGSNGSDSSQRRRAARSLLTPCLWPNLDRCAGRKQRQPHLMYEILARIVVIVQAQRPVAPPPRSGTCAGLKEQPLATPSRRRTGPAGVAAPAGGMMRADRGRPAPGCPPTFGARLAHAASFGRCREEGFHGAFSTPWVRLAPSHSGTEQPGAMDREI